METAKTRLRFSAGGCILMALMLLMLPLKWMLGAMLAAAVHECSHAAAVKLCGGWIGRIEIGTNGIRMEIGPMTPGKELICALSGPLGGLCLLFLARWFPRTALCGAIHSFYNLLPVYPLDGGRALRCGAELVFSPLRAERIGDGVQSACMLGILAVSVYGFFCLKTGFLPFAVFFILLIKSQREKIPCNAAQFTVQ